MREEKGFLVLEMLIAGLILTSSIAATMYLFRMGFEHLERINTSNAISSKIPQAISLVKALDIGDKSGDADLGDNVWLVWHARLVDKSRPIFDTGEMMAPSMHELFIYKIDFVLSYRKVSREYGLNVFKYKTLVSPEKDF